MIPLDLGRIQEILRIALDEDLGSGDVTSFATIPPEAQASARYTTKQPLVVSGLPVVEQLVPDLKGYQTPSFSRKPAGSVKI